MEDLPSVDVGLLLGSPDTLSEMKKNVNTENNRETNILEVFAKKLLTHLCKITKKQDVILLDLPLDLEAVHFFKVPVLGDLEDLGLGVASLLGGAKPDGRANLLTGLAILGLAAGAAGGLSDWGLSQLSILEVGGLGRSVEERSL